MRRTIAWLLVAVCLTGCAGTQVQHNTASGRPERVFQAQPDTVRAALVTELVNRGYRITKESQSLVEGEKFTDKVGAIIAYSTQYDSKVAVRVTYTMIPGPAGTRVIGDIQAVSNPGSGFERVHPLQNTASSADMQKALDGLQI